MLKFMILSSNQSVGSSSLSGRAPPTPTITRMKKNQPLILRRINIKNKIDFRLLFFIQTKRNSKSQPKVE